MGSVPVGHVLNHNSHAAWWNSYCSFLFRDQNEQVTETHRKVSQVTSGSVFASIPLSTLAALRQDPKFFGIGAGIGVISGLIYRVGKEIASPSTISYFEDWAEWLEHYAPMKTISKVGLAATGSTIALGNTTAGILFKDHYFVICEGATAGFFLGREGGGLLTHLIHPIPPSTHDETTPLNPSNHPAINA